MSQPDQFRQRLQANRRRLVLSLLMSGFLPLGVYMLARPLVASDTTALALSGAIPLLWTVVQWLRRGRINWINVIAVAGFALALGISVLTGGSPLALELREAVVASLVGLMCLLSVLVGKPLLLMAARYFGSRQSAQADDSERRINDPATRKRLTFSTVLIGLVLFVKAAIDLGLALTLPTASFLATSKTVNWALIGGAILFLWWMRHRAVGGSTG